MDTERQPGMVIDGVAHRPVQRDTYLGPVFWCGGCVSDWPCRAVVVEALRGSVLRLNEKVVKWKRHSDGQGLRGDVALVIAQRAEADRDRLAGELAECRRHREFSAEWNGKRWARLHELLKGTDLFDAACAIMANGTADWRERPREYVPASELAEARQELEQARDDARREAAMKVDMAGRADDYHRVLDKIEVLLKMPGYLPHSLIAVRVEGIQRQLAECRRELAEDKRIMDDMGGQFREMHADRDRLARQLALAKVERERVTMERAVATCSQCGGSGRLSQYGGFGADYDEIAKVPCEQCRATREALGQVWTRTGERRGEWRHEATGQMSTTG